MRPVEADSRAGGTGGDRRSCVGQDEVSRGQVECWLSRAVRGAGRCVVCALCCSEACCFLFPLDELGERGEPAAANDDLPGYGSGIIVSPAMGVVYLTFPGAGD